ncbi:hypothetical protein K8B33_06140 [Alcanivorax sp. JB21]|uniref:CARDB domain-containing protein n=1 Tax=Alcanivorax limicola TaxID=2874102 RepID=UPI001CBE0F0D|nr:CARDB domain-containing protein [Alcanivorax limicola]MBZ2188666.1 hypothetical protein [Alcanivorax limicola]
MKSISRCAAVVAALCVAFSMAPRIHASSGGVLDPFNIPAGMSAHFKGNEDDIALIEFAGSFDATKADGEPNAEARAAITREYFRHNADAYDFIFFFSLFDYELLEDALAFHMGVRNDVQGIGLPLYDLSPTFGSSGKLQGLIDMGPIMLDGASSSPESSSYPRLLNTAMHEVLHQWGIYVDFIDPETGVRSDRLRGHQDSHWSPLVHTEGSVQYGAKWLDNQNGSFTPVAERLFYSSLDLYLMGLLPPESVRPFFLIDIPDPHIEREAISAEGQTVFGRRINIGIEDIVAAEGPRVPSVSDAQKSFDAAFILVMRPGQTVPPEVLGRINAVRRDVAQRFSIMTGGKGLLNVHSRVRPVGETGEADIVADDAMPGEGEYSLGSALVWLRNRQQETGQWQDRTSTALKDTLLADAVLASTTSAYSHEDRARADQWLREVEAEDTDALARLASALKPFSTAAVDLLAMRQRPDGGWGLGKDDQSSVLDTALAVQGLKLHAHVADIIPGALARLIADQNPDGGWGITAGGASQLASTSEVIRAIAGIEQLQSHRGAAAEWLAARQSTSGAIGDGVASTALSLLALAEGQALDKADAAAAVNFLRQSQSDNGSWGDSVHNTALAVSAIQSAQFPDWALTEVSMPEGDVRDGDLLPVAVTVTNQGFVNAPATQVALYLGDPANGGILIDIIDIPALVAGGGVSVVLHWDTSGYGGGQHLYIVVDPHGNHAVAGGQGGLSDIPVEIHVPPAEIDIAPQPISLTSGEVSELPVTIGLSSVVRNVGTVNAEGVVLEWWVEQDGERALLHREHVNIAGRADFLATASYDWRTGGGRKFILVADPDGLLEESNSANNQVTKRVVPQAVVDLAVPGIAVVGTPALGQTVGIRVDVANLGTLDAPSTHLDIRIRNGADVTLLERISMVLAAGESRQLEVPWLVDETGSVVVIAEVDPDNLVLEKTKENNSAEVSVQAEALDGINLRVRHDDLVVIPDPLREGAGATLQSRVHNTGNLDAHNVKVALYDGNPGAGGVIIASVTAPLVPAAGSAEITAIWPEIAGSGNRLVYVVADPDNEIEEFDGTDNVAFRTFIVRSLPDAYLGAGSISVQPTLPRAGEPFTISARVDNIGQQALSDFPVVIYKGSAQPDNAIGVQRMDIAAGEAENAIFQVDGISEGSEVYHIVADPEGEVEESSKANNSARVTVGVQSGLIYTDHAYISPDGDGVQDQVRVQISGDAGEAAILSVETRSGLKVRDALPMDESVVGQFIWDGKNNSGAVVADGAYRIRLSNATGSAIASADVVVDTNRSSLTSAIESVERRWVESRSCDIATDASQDMGWRLSQDEQMLFFSKNHSNFYPGMPDGIHLAALYSDHEASIVTRNEHPDAERFDLLAVNQPGSHVAYGLWRPTAVDGPQYEIWERRIDSTVPGELLMVLGDVQQVHAEYGGDTRSLFALVDRNGELSVYNATYGHAVGLIPGTYGTVWRRPRVALLPNNSHERVIVHIDMATYDYGLEGSYVGVLNTESGSLSHIREYQAASWPGGGSGPEPSDGALSVYCDNPGDCEGRRRISVQYPMNPVWSPDGARFALGSEYQKLVIHDKDGGILNSYPLPTVHEWSDLIIHSPAWSPDGGRIAFTMGGAAGSEMQGYVSILDMDSGDVRKLQLFYHQDVPHSFYFQVWNGSTWTDVGKTRHAEKFSKDVIDLGRVLPDADGKYRLRIFQRGYEEGHIDSLTMLDRSGGQVAPSRATMLSTGEDVLSHVLDNDYLFVDVHEQMIEVEWDAIDSLSGKVLITAQEASPSELDIRPFSYPEGNGRRFYSVPVPRGPPAAKRHDGPLYELDPVFEVFSRPDTVHKPAMVRGYAYSDGEYLYAALDFALDSTREDRGDWAELRVHRSDGVRSFAVDAEGGPWGNVSFISTPEADWPHRYYEFSVPLDEVVGPEGDVVNISFRAYGSAGEFDLEEERLDFAYDLVWLPGDDAVLVHDTRFWHQYDHGRRTPYLLRMFGDHVDFRPVLQNVDSQGRSLQLSPQGRKLLYHDYPMPGACNTRPQGVRVPQLYALDTLDNLTADMRVMRAAGGAGLEIYGTATDKHFDRFEVEYLAHGETQWRPVRPVGSREQVDALIATWVPPAAGRYRVRLVVHDKAGNSHIASRNIVWSESSPITDVYLSDDLFAPSADTGGDGLSLNFRVRSPVNLSVDIFYGDTLIRTLSGAFDLVGEQAALLWDGRDQDGRLVPDGEYRIVILGLEYRVKIDNTPPSFLISMAENPAVCVGHSGSGYLEPGALSQSNACRFLVRDTLLNVTSQDDDIASVRFEYSDYGADHWSAFDAERVADPGEAILWQAPLQEADIANKRYRIVAQDHAGNRSVTHYVPTQAQNRAVLLAAKAPYKKPELKNGAMFHPMLVSMPYAGGSIATEGRENRVFRYKDIDHERGPSGFLISETLTSPPAAVFAEFRTSGRPAGEWQRDRVLEFMPQEWERCFSGNEETSVCAEIDAVQEMTRQRIHLRWDTRKLPASGTSELRFVLVGHSGDEVRTQALPFNRPIWRAKGVSEEGADYVLSGTIYQPMETGWIDVHLSSDEDERYRSKTLVASIPMHDYEPGQDFKANLPLLDCHRYTWYASARNQAGTIPLSEHASSYGSRCLAMAYAVMPVGAASDQARLIVAPLSSRNVPLSSLSIGLLRQGNVNDVLLTDNSLANGRAKEYMLDVTGWPEGTTTVLLWLVDEEGSSVAQHVPIYIDSSPPELSINTPGEGTSHCLSHPAGIVFADDISTSEQGAVPEDWQFSAQPSMDLVRSNFSLLASSFTQYLVFDELGATLRSTPASLLSLVASVENESGVRLFSSDLTEEIRPGSEGVLSFSGQISLGETALPDSDVERAVKLVVRATDAAGNTTTAERGFFLEGPGAQPDLSIVLPSGERTGAGTYYLNPDISGFGGLQMELGVSKPGEVVLQLHRRNTTVEGSGFEYIGDIKRFPSLLEGQHQSHWDVSLMGDKLADGIYAIVPVLRDYCGQLSRVDLQFVPRIVVDTTAPKLSDVRPEAGSLVGLMVSTGVVLEELNPLPEASSGLDLVYRDTETEAEVPLDIWKVPNEDGLRSYAGEWNTYGHSGLYELIWRATDRAGNRTEQRIPVTVSEREDLIAALAILTPYVSPNRDGRLDVLRYRVSVTEAVHAELAIRPAGTQTPIHTETLHLLTGDTDLAWDALRPDGSAYADGLYELAITATSSEHAAITQHETAYFSISTVAPIANVSGLSDGFLTPPFMLELDIIDPLLELYDVQLHYEDELIGQWDGEHAVRHLALRHGRDAWQEGAHSLSIHASNLAGNTVTERHDFVVDYSPPALAWLAPSQVQYGGTSSVDIPWMLSVEEANPSQLSVTIHDESSDAELLYQGVPDVATVEGFIETEGRDGRFRLLAEMHDLAGNRSEIEWLFDIDRLAPIVEIHEPEEGDYLTGEFALHGLVVDRNIEQWRVVLEQVDGAPGQMLGHGAETREGLLGHYVPGVADGNYVLRLIAEDKVGHESIAEVNVVVDTTPPSAPTALTIIGPEAGIARLSWQPPEATDLDHYRIYDRGELLAEQVLSPEWSFVPIPDRNYRFEVVAVDHAGNRSESSSALVWKFDTQGPAVAILTPAAGDRVSGYVNIIGSAFGPEFGSYQLSVANGQTPDSWHPISESSLAKRGERLGQWDTLSGLGDGEHLLMLEASNVGGNISRVQLAIHVDNSPPDAPSMLQANLEGEDVLLSWEPSASSDVRGYLLTRNGRIVGASGPVIGEVTPYLIAGNSAVDIGVPDGLHDYAVYAYDHAGNASEPAETSISVDLRAPDIHWLAPSPHAAFENSVMLQIGSDDLDIAVVRFRYRVLGDTAWFDLSPDQDRRPYTYSWDTRNQAYGSFEIQAQAWDQGGQSSVSETRVIHRTDLTPPDAPSSFSAQVDGDSVNLSWQASNAEDVAFYNVYYRMPPYDEWFHRSEVSATQTTYTAPETEDGDYVFAVSAVDNSGNESTRGDEVEVLVFAPVLEMPPSIIDAPYLMLSGHSPADGQVVVHVASDPDAPPVASAAAEMGAFSLQGIPLSEGLNAFDLWVEYGDGHRSRKVEMQLLRVARPYPVRDLAHEFPDPGNPEHVRLSWREPLNTSQAWYIISNEEQVLNARQDAVPESYATSSWGWYYLAGPDKAFDGLADTAFRPYSLDWDLTVVYPETVWLSELELDWLYSPRAVRLWGSVGGLEVLLAEQQYDATQSNPDHWRMAFDTPWPVSSLRLEVEGRGGIGARLARMNARSLSLSDALQFDTYLERDDWRLSVEALNQYGQISEPAFIDIQSGDREPPEPVVLSVEVDGASAMLSWPASTSLDVAQYRVYRDGELLTSLAAEEQSTYQYTDAGLANGVYLYQIRPLDAAGNLGEFSNTALASIDTGVPGTPGNLVTVPDPVAGCIDLSWSAAAGGQVVAYRVLRAENDGAFHNVAEVTGLVWRDCDVYPDVQYTYQIVAVDALGNGGDPSGPASDYAEDTVPPAPPVITAPVEEDGTYAAEGTQVDIAGSAEPFSRVRLYRDGLLIGETQTSPPGQAMAGVILQPVNGNDVPILLSPSAQWAVMVEQAEEQVYVGAWPTGQVVLPLAHVDEFVGLTWIDGGRLALVRLVDGQYFSIDIADLASGSSTQLHQWPLGAAVPGMIGFHQPSGQLYLPEYDMSGHSASLLRVDVATGLPQRDTIAIGMPGQVHLSATSQKLAWQESGQITVHDLTTQQALLLSHCPAAALLGWTADSQQVVTISPEHDAIQVCDLEGGVAVVRAEHGAHYTPPVDDGALPTRGMLFMDSSGDAPVLYTHDGHSVKALGEHRPSTNLFYQHVDLLDDGRFWASYMNLETGEFGIAQEARAETLGEFRFSDVALRAPESRFHAVAIDRFGHHSGPSGEIRVTSADMPIANLGVSLAGPKTVARGNIVLFDAVVTNSGNLPMPATPLVLTMLAPDGSSTLQLDVLVPVLDPGEQARYPLSWAADSAGGHTLDARLGSVMLGLDDVPGDNRASHQFQVVDAQDIGLALWSSTTEVRPGQVVAVDWSISNPTWLSHSGDLVFSLEDVSGGTVAELARLPSHSVPAGGLIAERQSLVMPEALPGDYRLAVAFDSARDGKRRSAQWSVLMLADVQLSLAVSGSGRQFLANQQVDINVDLTHHGVSGIASDMTLQVAVTRVEATGPGDQPVMQHDIALPVITPGDQQRYPFAWQTGTHTPGDYLFHVVLVDAHGVPQASASYAFSLVLGVPQLRGVLSLDQAILGIGQPWAVAWQVANEGNHNFDALPFSIEARRDGGVWQSLHDDQLVMPPATTQAGQVSIDEVPPQPGTYQLRLRALAEVGGHTYPQVLATAALTVRDIQAPVASVRVPAADAVINTTRTMLTVLAEDSISGVSHVRWRQAGGAWQAMTLSGEAYTAPLVSVQEGAAAVEVQAFDHAGNASAVTSRHFVVDNTRPSVAIAGVQGGVFYNSPVTPVVTVEDTHLLFSTVTLNGMPWSGGPVLLEGSHQLEVLAEDQAGNRRQVSLLFTLDMTPPLISIGGVSEGHHYNTPVEPMISVSDDHLSRVDMTLNGLPYEGGLVSEEGSYVLAVEARDLAGNIAQRDVSFVLDMTPPAPPVVTSVADGDLLDTTALAVMGSAEPATQVRLERNGNASTVQADAAGHFQFPVMTFSQGLNTISLTAMDAAGNVSAANVLSFTVQSDITPPVIVIEGAENGAYYNHDVVLSISIHDESGVAEQHITLNGAVYESGASIVEEGSYQLVVEAQDTVGNQASRTLQFVIDRSPPIIAVDGVVDEAFYNHAVTPEVSVVDASPVETQYALNGLPFEEGATIEQEGEYLLRITAVDAAGNESVVALFFTLDMTPPLPPTLLHPEEGAVIHGPDVTIEGSSEPGSMVTLRVDELNVVVPASEEGAFSAVVSLSPGAKLVTATASDNAGNVSGASSRGFAVLESDMAIEPAPVLQRANVLLWHRAGGGQSQASRTWYQQTLQARGIHATVVSTETAFMNALDSERFNVLMLVGDRAALGQPLYMSAEAIMRIRGSVASGYGLIWINTTPNLLESWHDIIGARTSSTLSRVDHVHYPQAEGDALQFPYDAETGGFVLLSAQAVGHAEPDCQGFAGYLYCAGLWLSPGVYPAVLQNEYGNGQVKTLAFDPFRIGNPLIAGAVLDAAVRRVSPDAMESLPYVLTTHVSFVTGSDPNEAIEVSVSVPPGVRIEPVDGGTLLDDQTLIQPVDAGLPAPVRYQLSSGLPGQYPVQVQVYATPSGAVMAESTYYFVLQETDQQLVDRVRQRLSEDLQHVVLAPTLWLSLQYLDAATAAYLNGHYAHADYKLYMAMLNLRLHPGYNRQTMAAMGEFQRLIVSRQQ